MSKETKKINEIAKETFEILDTSIITTDVGDNRFYKSFLDYMVNQGYNDGNFISKVWDKIEENYL